MMKQVGGFTGLTAAVLLIGAVGVLQTGCVSWDSEPDPEADAIIDKDVERVNSNTFFQAVNDIDFDTKTVTRQNSVTVTLEEDPGRSGSQWLIIDIGNDTYFEDGMGATADLSPWHWKTQGQGDFGAISFTSGGFIFDDGRDELDARHDRKLVAGGQTLKIIPDTITTEYAGCELNPTGSVFAYLYKHHLYNSDFPEFSFEGLKVEEDLIAVFCAGGECDDGLLQSINEVATGDWIIDSNNAFPECDKHGSGQELTQAIENHGTVIIWQVFRIANWGWPEVNEGHHIGRDVEGGLFNFSGIHLLAYSIFDPNKPSNITVLKNGLGPSSYDPQLCELLGSQSGCPNFGI